MWITVNYLKTKMHQYEKFYTFLFLFHFNIPHKPYRTYQYFTLSVAWYLAETSAVQMNSERGELCPQRYWIWDSSVLSQEQGENNFWNMQKLFDLSSESAWTLEVSVSPQQQRARGCQNLPDPFLTLQHSKKPKRWDECSKMLSLPNSLYTSLTQAFFLSPSLSSRLHSIT